MHQALRSTRSSSQLFDIASRPPSLIILFLFECGRAAMTAAGHGATLLSLKFPLKFPDRHTFVQRVATSGCRFGSRVYGGRSALPAAAEHQNRLSVARPKGAPTCVLQWPILQEPEPLSPRSPAVSAVVF